MGTDARPDAGESLKFDAAEQMSGADSSGEPTCTNCGNEITRSYHEANGKVVCPPCRAKLEEMLNGNGGGAGRFLRAVAFGAIGAAIGAGLYYAILALTGYEFGLIAVVVGWLVGRGVSIGANHRGGWRYQALAIVLTYVAIVSTYIPLAIRDGVDAPLPVLFIVSLALPFLAGIQNIIGLAIIGFALYQAWSMNKRLQIAFTGPYEVKPASGAAPSVAGA